MKTRFILYILDYQLIAYQVSSKTVKELKRFPATLEGQEAFEAWLPKSPLKPLFTPVCILLDSRQEEYHVDYVPHVIGLDRKQMLAHRLRHQYPNTPYTYAFIQGRAKNPTEKNRRDDQALLLACGNSDLLDVWISPLLKRRIALRGVYSLPLLTQQILPLLNADDYSLIVNQTEQVAPNSPHGMRQSFFSKGHLVLSRLTPLPEFQLQADNYTEQTVANYVEHITEEILKTRQYLRGTNMLPHQQPLTVYLFPEPYLLKTFSKYLLRRSTPALEYKLWSSTYFAQQQGIKHIPQHAYLNVLSVYQLAKSTTRNHYADTKEIIYFSYLQMRRRLQITSLLLILGASCVAAYSTYEALGIQKIAKTTESKVKQTQMQYQQAQIEQRQKLGVDVDVIHIKNTVDAAYALQQQYIEPYSAITILGQALAGYPQLIIKELSWYRQKSVQNMPSNIRQLSGLQRRLLEKRQALAQNKPPQFEQRINIIGEVRPFNGDVIKAQKTVSNFVNALKKLEDINKVHVLDSPLKINLKNGFKGRNATIKSEQNNAAFSLDITFKIDNDNEKK
jgi:hypothetical protein